MSVRGWKSILTAGPRGSWSSLSEKRTGKPVRASIAQNVRFSPGVVKTRPAISAAAGANSLVRGLHNWITPDGVNYVIYQDGAEIRTLNQATSVVSVVATPAPTSIAPVFADRDIFTYFCGYDQFGYGTFQARVSDGIFADLAFRGPPPASAWSAADAGAGNSTVGTHYLGVVYQNRTGYAGVPVTTVIGAPMLVTLGATLRKINFSITFPGFPDGGGDASLFLIMTRADNPSKWYFIPTDSATGSVGVAAVALSVAATYNFVANRSDEDIALLDSADINFNWFTLTAAIRPQFRRSAISNVTRGPSFVSVYGKRMVYGFGKDLLVSNEGQAQQLALDQNSVEMPNQQALGMGFQLPNSPDFYVTGDRWTARVTDNGDTPSTWAPPIQVSDALGARFPCCVCYRTSGNYAWIATERGIELFNGAYAERPITYLVSDLWARVNWAAAYTIEMADDTTGLRLFCAVPLDGATSPTHLIVVDYTNGMTFDTCDISYDVFAAYGALSSVAAVKELAGTTNIWLAVATHIVHFDTTQRTDDFGYAINSYWESGLVSGGLASKTFKVGAADIWARGAGTLNMTWYGPDRVRSVAPVLLTTQGVPATLTTSPGLTYMTKAYISKVEAVTCRFGTNAPGEFFELSSFSLYIKHDVFNR